MTIGKEIDFIARNGSLTGKTIIANASYLVGMAYDDDSYTMFLSDVKNSNFSIFSVDLSARNITIKPILKSKLIYLCTCHLFIKLCCTDTLKSKDCLNVNI